MATWKKVVVESSSNTIAQNTSGNSATVTTNANLTGNVTSSGNATTIANNVITKNRLSVGGTDGDYKVLSSISSGTGLTWQSLPTATDTIANGNSNPATSNGVFDAIAALSDANTTYTTSVVDNSPDVKIRLTGSDSSTDDVTLAGSGGAGDGGFSYSISGSNITPKVGDNAISADQLHVSGDGSSGQILASDGDGSFSWVADSQVSVDAGLSSSSSNPVENHAVFDALALKEDTISSSNRVDATNVGSGVISNTEFNFLNGVNSAIQTQLDAKVGTSGNETITGNKTFSGNTSVANLTVTGTTTTVETETIKLADNVIELNSNATGTPVDSTDVGIVVNRGDSADAYLTWDEGEDRWSKSLHNNPTSKAFLQTVVVSTSATAPTANLDGVGMMYMADGVPYIRTV